MKWFKTIWLTLIFAVTAFTLYSDEDPDYQSLKSIIELGHKLSNDYRQGKLQQIPFISIGGRPGVGKSYLSDKMCDILKSEGVNVVVFKQDHFNKDSQERAKYDTDWDYRHLEYEWMHEVLNQIVAGESWVIKPYIDQMSKERGIEVWDMREVHLVILDGSYALSSKQPIDFLCYSSIAIYIETEAQNARRWKWERELLRKNPRTQEQFELHMVDIMNDFDQNIAPTKSDAHCIIYKNDFHHYSVEVLKK